jgi:hypothetical protein
MQILKFSCQDLKIIQGAYLINLKKTNVKNKWGFFSYLAQE